MTNLRKDKFPRGTHSKLNYKKIGPCRILRKIYDNAYKFELPEYFDIYPIFNVVDLYSFHEGDDDDEYTMTKWKKKIPIKQVEELEHVLVKRIHRKT